MFEMCKMYTSFTIILMFLQLASMELYKTEQDQSAPEVLSTYDLNQKTTGEKSDLSTTILCNSILSKFERNNHVLFGRLCRLESESFNNFISQSSTRSLIKREASCSLTKEKVSNVKIRINEAILEASTKSATCCISETYSNNCEKWLRFLQCAADFLKDGVKQVNSNNPSVQQIDKWEALYKKIIYSYEQEEVTRESFTQDMKQHFDLLGGDLQAAERMMYDLKKESKNNKMKICIENINNGYIRNATECFQQINKNSVLIDITRTAYEDSKRLQHLNRIMDFGSALSNCSQKNVVFTTLYNLLEENNELNSPYVLILHEIIKTCMEDTPIEAKLKVNSQKVIESWSNSIQNSNYSDFIKFLDTYGHGYATVDFCPEVIERAYGRNLKNAKSILKFIQDIIDLEVEFICLKALYENMKDNGNLNSSEILMVALNLKEIMAKDYYWTMKKDLKNQAVGLKNSFPASVRNLIWNGGNCTIRAKEWKEYLYSPTKDWNYDSQRRNVFTWMAGGPKFIEGFWNLSPELNGEYFIIKNNYFNEYLYAGTSSFDYNNKRRRVFTWIPGTSGEEQGEWILIPLNDGNDFAIKNKHYSEYLYAATRDFAEDRDRRRVFTWKEADYNKITSDIIWQIDCDSS